MASWALVLAIIALVCVLTIIIISYLFFTDIYKKEINSLNRKMDILVENVGKTIIEDKDGKFWPIVREEISRETKASVSPLLGKIFGTILSLSFAELRDFLAKFPKDRLIENIVKAIKEMHPQDQNKP